MEDNSKIYQVNELIRGIVVGPGIKTHTMTFKPKDYKYGKILSNITFLFILIIILMPYIQKKYEA